MVEISVSDRFRTGAWQVEAEAVATVTVEVEEVTEEVQGFISLKHPLCGSNKEFSHLTFQ